MSGSREVAGASTPGGTKGSSDVRTSVWAPKAKRVEVETGNRRLQMTLQEGGWWVLDSGAVASGADYSFVLDGGKPLPDPRTPWQPYGVHGPSRSIDHASFAWTDTGWNPPPLSSAIIYELHVGTFTPLGTFEGAIERLPHLTDLGITHVELMPVAEFSGDRGWGYDGVDLYAPHHAYGGPDGLKRLVDACHARGLAVILDVVYNHFGPSGNYLAQFGPYQTDHYRTPWGDAINFDRRGSDEVRRFLIDNALMWLRDYHFDALRLDAVHSIADSSAVHFLEQLAGEVASLEASLGRHLTLIAESNLNDPRLVKPVAAGGYGLAAQWSDDFHHALHCYLTGERAGYYADFGDLTQVGKALQSAFVYDGCYSHYRGRHHGRPATGLSGNHFLGYAQTHDQVGNRAKGERSSMLMSVERLKIAAALVMTSPFIPMLFQGEEWAASTPFLYFTGHPEADLGRAVSEGRKQEFAEFGWDPREIPDPQAPDTFARSKLDWSELTREPHTDLLRWHRELIRLRRRSPELTDGRLDRISVQFDQATQWLTMTRHPTAAVYNFAGNSQKVRMAGAQDYNLVLASRADVRIGADYVEMPPESVVILRSR
jgi:maltooligosyltrehalose trehalohydrolase